MYDAGMRVGVVRSIVGCGVLVYYNNPKTPEEAEVTQKQIIGNGVDYGPWVANAAGNPKRQRWIERMRALAPDAL